MSCTAWARRAVAHPEVFAVLAAGEVSESFARTVCVWTDTIPASIRRAVRLRDRHCQWAGGCNQPAAACDVHHVRHKASGGTTSLGICVLLGRFHHLIAIHRWGWTLVLNPDGTTTAWNKDKTRILHSHSPPARAG
ncbi:MAG TPA: HNH endonuclease signature motif containing protein [Streptosporangiaceae bacterium]|nr:HNH endonuclease signature motif containing protein [Streptosporangiaceae bacterium]